MDQKALDTVREVVEESFSELKPGIVEFAGSFMFIKLNERLKPQGFDL